MFAESDFNNIPEFRDSLSIASDLDTIQKIVVPFQEILDDALLSVNLLHRHVTLCKNENLIWRLEGDLLHGNISLQSECVYPVSWLTNFDGDVIPYEFLDQESMDIFGLDEKSLNDQKVSVEKILREFWLRNQRGFSVSSISRMYEKYLSDTLNRSSGFICEFTKNNRTTIYHSDEKPNNSHTTSWKVENSQMIKLTSCTDCR